MTRHIPTSLRLFVIAALASSIDDSSAQVTSYGQNTPQGIFALGPAGKPVPHAILRNKSVAGVVLRSRWQDVERNKGLYDFSFFDREVPRVSRSGKDVVLRVVSGGRNTPDWLMAEPGLVKYHFSDPNPYHKRSFGKQLSIPVFWDPILLRRQKRLLKRVGRRFASHSDVVGISIGCANSLTGDWNFPAKSPKAIEQWRSIGYSPEKLLDACNTLVKTAMDAFPGKTVTLPLGIVKLDRPRTRVARAVLQYAKKNFPTRFMPMRANLFAGTPDPAEENVRGAWRLIYEHRPDSGAQMLWKVSTDATFRMNRKRPGDKQAIYERAMQTGVNYGLSFIEVYYADLVDEDLASITERVAQDLKANR